MSLLSNYIGAARARPHRPFTPRPRVYMWKLTDAQFRREVLRSAFAGKPLKLSPPIAACRTDHPYLRCHESHMCTTCFRKEFPSE